MATEYGLSYKEGTGWYAVDERGVDSTSTVTTQHPFIDFVKDTYTDIKENLTSKVSSIRTGLQSLTDKVWSTLFGQNKEDEAKKPQTFASKEEEKKYNELYEKYSKVKNAAYTENTADETFKKGTFIPTSNSEFFNCIGFVCYMFGINQDWGVADFGKYPGFDLVKDVVKTNPLEKAQIGDVICLTGTYKGKSDNHAMVYAGNGYVWESTSGSETYGRGVRYQKFKYQYKWYIDNTNDYNIKIYRSK